MGRNSSTKHTTWSTLAAASGSEGYRCASLAAKRSMAPAWAIVVPSTCTSRGGVVSQHTFA
eukprot:850550-Pelagomonas_calceolata.AAC.6